MTAPVPVSCSKQTKSLTQTGLRSISGIGTDRRAWDNASDVVQNPGVSRLVETHRRKAPDSSEWSAAELVVFFIKNEGAPILTPAH